MLPEWLSRLIGRKDLHQKTKIRQSKRINCPNEEPPTVRKRNTAPPELARSLSFHRANARAKSSRLENFQATYSQGRRLSQSIDALYVLASLKDGIPDGEILEFEEQSIYKLSRSEMGIKNVAMSLMDRGQDLWDGEFSSMSSCASDRDSLFGKTKVIASVVRPGPDSNNQNVNPADCLKERDLSFAFDTDSSRSEQNFADSNVLCASASGDSWLQEEPIDEEQRSFLLESEKKNSLQNRRRRRVSSFSASLPADIHGAVEDSFALVKFSHNPYRDFRESMCEMIVVNELDECTDMEELLYCYLSLNAPDHHDLIKEAFIDVWTEMLTTVS